MHTRALFPLVGISFMQLGASSWSSFSDNLIQKNEGFETRSRCSRVAVWLSLYKEVMKLVHLVCLGRQFCAVCHCTLWMERAIYCKYNFGVKANFSFLFFFFFPLKWIVLLSCSSALNMRRGATALSCIFSVCSSVPFTWPSKGFLASLWCSQAWIRTLIDTYCSLGEVAALQGSSHPRVCLDPRAGDD